MAEDLAGAAAAWSSKASTSRPLIVLEEREADEKRARKAAFATAHVSEPLVVAGIRVSLLTLSRDKRKSSTKAKGGGA